MPDDNETDLVPSAILALLTEYGKAQDSAEHHDRLVWQVTSILWAANTLLLGFTLSALASGNTLLSRLISILLAVIGVVLLWMAAVMQTQFRDLKRQKYDRCKEIERTLGLKQHRAVVWKKSQQTVLYRYVLGLFIGVWAAIAILPWVLIPSGTPLPP